jgi:hypothetical protein
MPNKPPITPQELREMADAIDPTKGPPPYGYMSGVPNTLRQLASFLERAPERRLTREQVLTAIKRGGYSYDKQTDEIMKLIEGTK